MLSHTDPSAMRWPEVRSDSEWCCRATWVRPPADCTYPITSTASLRPESTIIDLAMLQSPSAAMMPTPVRPISSSVFRRTLATKTCSQRNPAGTSRSHHWQSHLEFSWKTQLNVGGCFCKLINDAVKRVNENTSTEIPWCTCCQRFAHSKSEGMKWMSVVSSW